MHQAVDGDGFGKAQHGLVFTVHEVQIADDGVGVGQHHDAGFDLHPFPGQTGLPLLESCRPDGVASTETRAASIVPDLCAHVFKTGQSLRL